MDDTIALQRAREATARDDRDMARRLLADALYEHPRSEAAWMMLSTVVDQPDRKRDCLERVLRINPGNGAAREQLAALEVPAAATPPLPEAAPLETGPGEPESESALPETKPEPAAPGDESSVVTREDILAPSLATEPAPEDAAVGTVQQTATEVSHPPPESAADALAAPLGEPVPELRGEPSSPPSTAPPKAVGAQSRSLLEALAPGEVVLHWTRLSPGVFLPPLAAVLGATVLFLLPTGDLDPSLVLTVDGVLLVSALLYLGLRAIRYFSSEYVVTDRRVLARRGFLARLTVDIPIAEIEEVTVGRGLFGRSPSSGNVWIRRTDRTQVMFWRIRYPAAFRDAIEQGRDAVKETVL